MAEKQILLISQVFYPDEVAVANLFTNLCSVLVQSGLGIEVWCAQPSYTTNVHQLNEREYKGIKIHYLKSTSFPKDRMSGRISNLFTFSTSAAFKLMFSRDKRTVVSHTTPPFLAIVLSFICSLKKRRFIYILMDVFPDGLIRLKKVSSGNIFIKIWQTLHLAALKRCSEIIVIGRDMKNWILSFYPEGSEKIHYIPLWQDANLIRPVGYEDNPFVIQYNLVDQFVVQYSGNLGLWNEMEPIGFAINSNIANVKFVIIGGGMRKKELDQYLKKNDNENLMFLPFQTNENYSFSVSACHAALVSLRNGLQGMAVPSKIIGIMAAGIPVIALVPPDSEIAYILEEEECGVRVDPNDGDGLTNAILRLKSDDKLRQKLGKNGRDAFLRKYTTEVIAEKYLSIIGG